MRKAILEDIPDIVRLGALMHAESRYRRFSFNPQKMAENVSRMIQAGQIVLIDGQPTCAMFIGIIDRFWWGDDLESSDLLLYVLPEKRKGAYAYKLVSAYIKICKELGVKDIKIGHSTGVDPMKTTAFYAKLGFKAFGQAFELGETVCAAEQSAELLKT